MEGRRFEPNGFTNNPDIPSATSIPDYIFRYLRKKFLDESASTTYTNGMQCPDCGNLVVAQEGCTHCLGCGWSKC
jgi:hypothetical protein